MKKILSIAALLLIWNIPTARAVDYKKLTAIQNPQTGRPDYINNTSSVSLADLYQVSTRTVTGAQASDGDVLTFHAWATSGTWVAATPTAGSGGASLKSFMDSTSGVSISSMNLLSSQFTRTTAGSSATFVLNAGSVTLQGNELSISTVAGGLQNLSSQFYAFSSTTQAQVFTALKFSGTAQTLIDQLTASTQSFRTFQSTTASQILMLETFTSTAQGRVDALQVFTSTVQSRIDELQVFSSTGQSMVFAMSIDTGTLFSLLTATAITASRYFDSNNSTVTAISNSTSSIFSMITASAVSNSNFWSAANSTMTDLSRSTQAFDTWRLNGPIGIYDSANNFIGNATTIKFGTNLGVTGSGSTATVTGSAGGGGSGDNLGSHTSTQTLNSNNNGIINVSSMTIGASTSAVPTALMISSQTPSKGFCYICISSGTESNPYDLTQSSFTVRIQTTTILSKSLTVGTTIFSQGSGANVHTYFLRVGPGLSAPTLSGTSNVKFLFSDPASISRMVFRVGSFESEWGSTGSDFFIGTPGSQAFAIRTGDSTAASWDTSQNLTASGNINMSSGKVLNLSALNSAPALTNATQSGTGITVKSAAAGLMDFYAGTSGSKPIIRVRQNGVIIGGNDLGANTARATVVIGTSPTSNIPMLVVGSATYNVMSVDGSSITLSSPTYMVEGASLTISGSNAGLNIRTLATSAGTVLVIDSDGNVFQQSSSKRYKKNINPLRRVFSKILNVKPVEYDYKKTGAHDIGYIAEDFEAQGLKDLVNYDNQGRPDSIKYDRITLYLIEVLKSQQKQIDDLKKHLNELGRK